MLFLTLCSRNFAMGNGTLIPAKPIGASDAVATEAHRPVQHEFAPWAPTVGAKNVASWTLIDGRWEVGDGSLKQTAHYDQGVFAFNNTHVLADTTLSARFKVEKTRNGVGAVDFLFRCQSSATYYFARFDSTNSQVSLWAATRNLTYPIVEAGYEPHPIPIAAGVWHEGKVEAIANSVKVILDGKLLIQTAANVFSSGTIGFCVEQGCAVLRDINVEGTKGVLREPWKHETPPPIVVERPLATWEKVIVKEAGAGGYEAYPRICRLANGDLLCVLMAGYYHNPGCSPRLPKGGRVCYVRSKDKGKTWSVPKTLVDTHRNEQPTAVVQLRNGAVLCVLFDNYADTVSTWLCASRDNGRTWSSPWRVPGSPGFENVAAYDLLSLPDGSLVMSVSGTDYSERKGDRNIFARGAVFSSHDYGRTWLDMGVLGACGPGTTPPDLDSSVWEPAIVRLPKGKLICHTRSPLRQSESLDNGRTWSDFHLTNPRIDGYCPALLCTRDGILISAHRWPNTSLNFSLDGGKTWSDYCQVSQCWGAQPSMVELEDGKILVVYYEENSGSNIRAARFRATRDGVQFIPW